MACLTAAMAAFAVGNVPPALRANNIGYLDNDAVKAAVYLGDVDPQTLEFAVINADGENLGVDSVVTAPAWAPARFSARIYFSSLKNTGKITIVALDGTDTVARVNSYIGNDAYARLHINELPLVYLRQQRCGYNPLHDANCHQHDGFMVLSDDGDTSHYDVTGGWHDASDYLQYLTTSANTVYQLLFAYRESPAVWADNFDAAGRPGANGVADILDEARWGLEWMQRMNPRDSLFLNQIADDRDHLFVGAPQCDTTDYGYGPGAGRPVYPCAGHPYGLKGNLNRSRGLASSVGKFASSFALGAEVFAATDSAFATDLKRRATIAMDVAAAHPGACQTAPYVSPYFYEEDNWADDMELAAAALARITPTGADRLRLLAAAREYGRMEPVTPWMGADSARHYQWYPFINLGHYELARQTHSAEFERNMRSSLERLRIRGRDNAFMYGVPFIWCSNNLAVALVTQAMLYGELTGDSSYDPVMLAARDWLFGANPWGQTMMILPAAYGPSPADPHSAMTDMALPDAAYGQAAAAALPAPESGRDTLTGGLVDGPVYATIFNKLWGVHLRRPDTMAAYQGPLAVYHDDFSDYSTNEPTMDGTASLAFMLSRLACPSERHCAR